MTDLTLATFTVNGQTVTTVAELWVSAVPDITLRATATDTANTTIDDNQGDLSLIDNNTTRDVVWTVTVKSNNEPASVTYSVTLHIIGSDSTALRTFIVNNKTATNLGTVYLSESDVLNGAIPASIIPLNPNATVHVTLDGGLVTYDSSTNTCIVPVSDTGEFTLTVEVISYGGVLSESGIPSATYTVTISIASTADESLAILQVNGRDVSDGDTITIGEYTDISCVIIPKNPNANVIVTGLTYDSETNTLSGFSPNVINDLIITVEAEEGATTGTEHIVHINMIAANNTDLSVFKLTYGESQELDLLGEGPYNLPADARDVTVVATALNPEASVTAGTGPKVLIGGDNDITVTVTAQDNTTGDITKTVTVALSNNKAIDTLIVNSNPVTLTNGSFATVYLQNGTQSVTYNVITIDGNATASVTGNTNLVTGTNTMTITVTAENGSQQQYTVELVVALSNNTAIDTLTVNGNPVTQTNGSFATVYLQNGTQSVTYNVTTVGPNASASVTGNTNLVTGTNTMTITVTAEDGSTLGYTVELFVAQPVVCFLGDAPVLTPAGYRRMDSLREGDMVTTADGRAVAIQRVKTMTAVPGPNANPYVIQKGQFGATEALPISPRHRVVVPGRGLVEARELGLRQMTMRSAWTYYNLELPNWHSDRMVVAGVEVESLAAVERIRMPMATFKKMLADIYGPKMSASVLAAVKRTVRVLADGSVEAPMVRNKSK